MAVVLGGIGACDGAKEKKSDDKPTAVVAKALTEAQLKAVSFTDGDKVGAYTASEYDLGSPLGEDYTADPADCQPLVSLAKGATAHDPAAEVNRGLDVLDEWTGPSVTVQLRSYAKGEAAAVMRSLGAAGSRCAAGFTEERAIAKAKYLRVEPVKAPAFGDEARAYRFTVLDVKGKLKLYEYLTVVRSGSTTLSFRAEIIGTKDIGGVPEEVMKAQWEKFRAGSNTGA
ncbi:hypothetical protein [Streptomyces sp. NPDC005408]|uniref:hypothetical protein n=1 Tax=Streptomyces sp. NPDC005408 TaxID=3155341 RepID=UPI0033B181A4